MAPLVLVGIHDVAELLDVSIASAYRFVRRDDFPAPYDGPEARIARGRVWRRGDVVKWAKKPPVPLDRKPGRPPKN